MAKRPKLAPKPKPSLPSSSSHIRTHADYEDEITEGHFSDLGGFTDDLDLDINEKPSWEQP